MVNPKQLRLGNYIQDRGGKVLRIDFMEHVQDGYDTKVGQLMQLEGQEVHPMTEYTDYANPIHLTEEWLLRLGFRCTSTIKKTFGNGVIWVQLIDNVFCFKQCDSLTRKLSYVHSIQNLYFALTGEELEIKSDTMS